MRTLLVLLDKEFRQFFRNPFLPKMAVAFPMMVMLVIPWITTMDVRHVGVSVVDNDRSTASRRLVGKIGASDYFRLYGVTEHYGASLAALGAGRCRRDRRDSRRFRTFDRGTVAPQGEHHGQRRECVEGESRFAVYGADRHGNPRRTARRRGCRTVARPDYGAEPLQSDARLPCLHDPCADDHAAYHAVRLPACTQSGGREGARDDRADQRHARRPPDLHAGQTDSLLDHRSGRADGRPCRWHGSSTD